MAEALTRAYPRAVVRCRDLLQDAPRWLRAAYPATYYTLVRHCSRLWGMGFELLDRRWVDACAQPIRRAWNLLVTRRFIRQLRADPPDLVIATHFLPADVFSACKRAGWLAAPLVVVVTDCHPHRFWLSPEADAYVLAIDAGAVTAVRRGIAPDRLHVLGIPIAGGFQASFERSALERMLQLAPDRRTILVTSGATTVGPFEAVVEALIGLEAALPHRMQLLVVCGDNARAARRLEQRARDAAMPVRVFGFINSMPEAMAASDLIVAKAGGLTVMEALGRGVPLVFYHVIPGQERLNARHVVQRGAALWCRSPDDVAAAVRRCMEEPQRLARMREAAGALSRPDAAQQIVRRVVAPLLERCRVGIDA